MLFVDYLRQQPLYSQLVNAYYSVEGNLLERADDCTTEAQVEALRYALQVSQPTSILETGTNKGLFGYVLSHTVRGVTLYTFDGDARSMACVEMLNAEQRNIRIVFTLGDTKQTLSDFSVADVGFAWIDGGHDEPTACSDIRRAMRLAVPLIAIDDARTMPEVGRAIQSTLSDNSAYERMLNPFYEHDARGIVFLRHV